MGLANNTSGSGSSRSNGTLAFLILAAGLARASGLPAFPGAEGFGTSTPGGRGGEVLFVTNLNDSGPGSLRAAIESSGPRMVLFRVSGIIRLKSALRTRNPFVTIAGQSAPGYGICLRDYPLIVETHDVVIRHLRSRLGDETRVEGDAVSVGSGSFNVVLDHVSASWSVDESLSVSGDLRDVTVQWCLIAESLRKSVHSKGAHGYGSLVRATGGISLHHNLWAHHTARNPRLGDNYGKGEPVFDVRQNVVFNWGAHCTGMVDGRIRVNYTDNLLIPGPDTQSRQQVISLTQQAGSLPQFFLTGNRVEGAPDLLPQAYFGSGRPTLVTEPFDTPPVVRTPSSQLEAVIIEKAGASRPRRDPADERIVLGVRQRKGRMIDSQKEVGGWPEYHTRQAPTDSDGDGMPDNWERARGLNPRVASDGTALSRTGYTNLEDYLNELAR